MKVITEIRGCYTDEGVLLGRWKSKVCHLGFYKKKIEKIVYKYSDAVTGISPVMCHYIKTISPSSKPVYSSSC